MAKNNFILYKDYKPNVDILDDDQAGKLFKAIFAYVEDRTEPNFTDGMLKMAFQFIKNQLERDLEKYNIRVEANKENGKLGGRPKKEPKKPTGIIKKPNNPPKAKKGDNDYVYDNVYEYDYENDNEEIRELFYNFLKLRKKLRAVNSGLAINIQVGKFKDLDNNVIKQMLENAISSSWKSVFPLNGSKFDNKQDSGGLFTADDL